MVLEGLSFGVWEGREKGEKEGGWKWVLERVEFGWGEMEKGEKRRRGVEREISGGVREGVFGGVREGFCRGG